MLPRDLQLVRAFDLPAEGLRYERYQQVVDGAAVLGGQLTVFRDRSGTPTLVIGSRHEGVTPSNAVAVSTSRARRIAHHDVGRALARRVQLVIDPASGRFLYRVESVQRRHRWMHLIDASTGRILRRFDAVAHACGTQSAPCGFGVAYDDGDATDIKNLANLTRSNGSTFLLQSPLQGGYHRQETHDQGSTNQPFLGPIATDADDSWVMSGDESPAQPALVDAQYYARVTDDYLLTIHSFDWVARADADPANLKGMVLHAHFFKDYANAYWNGSYVALGDGNQTSFREFTSLDILAHELTHGVTDFTSDLIYENESGALNESFSDVVAAAVESYAESVGREPATSLQPDYLVGEDIDLTGDVVPGFRNMGDPEEDGDPDHYSELFTGTADNGGVHTNSGIPNHAFFLLANGGMNASCASPTTHASAHCSDGDQDDGLSVTGIGIAKARRIFFVGFTGLPEDATMCQARAGTEAGAETLFGSSSSEASSTADAWRAVGLTDAVCLGGTTANASPTSVGVVLGTPLGDDVSNLSADDGAYFRIDSELANGKQFVNWNGQAGVDPTGATELAVTYDGSYSRRVNQRLFVRNFDTSSWVLVARASVRTTDRTLSWSTSSPAPYISDTGAVRLRVQGRSRNPYQCRGDLMLFTVTY